MLTGEQSVAKSLHRLSVVRGGIIVGGIIVRPRNFNSRQFRAWMAHIAHRGLASCIMMHIAHRLVLIRMQRGAKMQLPGTELCQLGS